MKTDNDSYREPYLPWAPTQEFRDPDGGLRVTADSQTLLRQAPMTANEYLISAIDHIDNQLGKGYAAKHPELIAAFMQTSAFDLGAAVVARAIEGITPAIESVAEAIRDLSLQ